MNATKKKRSNTIHNALQGKEDISIESDSNCSVKEMTEVEEVKEEHIEGTCNVNEMLLDAIEGEVREIKLAEREDYRIDAKMIEEIIYSD